MLIALPTMTGNYGIQLLHDDNVKEVKTHAFQLKHTQNLEKKVFDVEKSDGMTIVM